MKCNVTIDINPISPRLIVGNAYISRLGQGSHLYIATQAVGTQNTTLVSLKTGTMYFNCSPENYIDVTDKVKVVTDET